ncbi:MAG: NADH-quinone oxidoreductase subunit N [Alphaproteobacteria bacterium]
MLNLATLMFAPEFCLLVFAIGFLFLNVFQKKNQDSAFLPIVFLHQHLYHVLLGLILLFFTFSWITYTSHGIAFHGFLTADRLTILSKTFMLCLGIGWFGLSQSPLSRSLKRDDYVHYEYPSLFLFVLIGAYIAVSAHHFLVMYLGLEIQAIPLCTAIALRRDVDRSLEASLKYFIGTIVSSAFLLLGIGFIFGASGTLSFEEIYKTSEWIIHDPQTLLWFEIGFCLVLAGIFFKIALVPFHLWLADVYEGATLTQVSIFSSVIKVSIVILLCRLLLKPFHSLIDLWKPILMAVGMLSVVWGTLGALFQTNIRRLFAYTSVSQLGLVMVGFSTGLLSGFVAALSYLFVYTLTTVAFFFFWATLNFNDQNLETVQDIRGLYKQHPIQSFLMASLLLSLATLPPLAGFWPKLFTFFSLIENNNFWVVGTLLFFSLISCFYYLRIIKNIYLKDGQHQINSSYNWKTLWSLVPLMVLGFIGIQSLVFNLVREALKSDL